MFLQPDWFEVLRPGVGTNRFSYSFNDPVNKLDPLGNESYSEKKDPLNWVLNKVGPFVESVVDDLSKRNEAASRLPWGARLSNAVNHAVPGAAASQRAYQAYLEGNYGQASAYAAGSMAEAALVFLPGTRATSVVTTPTKVVVATRVTPNALGRAGEAAVQAAYAIGPKVAISVSGRTRIPDGLTSTVLSEVKNVAALSYTSQLRDFATYASQTGRDFHLYVRPSTVLTRDLLADVANGSIDLRFIP